MSIVSGATASPSFAFPSAAATGHGTAAVAAPPDLILERMAAGAFRSLCQHLRDRSDAVQNMDLMAIGGFCRNCLAKWMVVEARTLQHVICGEGDVIAMVHAFARSEPPGMNQTPTPMQSAVTLMDMMEALSAFGYEQAAKEVYGVTYPEWKKRHQKEATAEQLRLYKESSHLHAKHDSEALKTTFINGEVRTEAPEYPRVLTRLQAGAFLRLCHHLRRHSDAVPNMELMATSGFCRNCLAKWLVVEARTVSDEIGADNKLASSYPEQREGLIKLLDSFGYDEAAQYVYGCTYPEWKKRHVRKATDDQLRRYNGSKAIHAKHDKELLATRSLPNITPLDKSLSSDQNQNAPVCSKVEPTQKTQLLSDVCCQDVDTMVPKPVGITQLMSVSILRPPKGDLPLTVGILTVSDRAAANAYASGDLSGPAVEGTMASIIDQMNLSFKDQHITLARVEKKIIADEVPDIKEALLQWSGKSATKGRVVSCDLIFTTGGTGFSGRDVTPEATLSILDRECQGLMSWASVELTSKQPLATLSRAAAGTCGNTLIVNLPGNPAGAAQVVEILFPLLVYAIKDLRKTV